MTTDQDSPVAESPPSEPDKPVTEASAVQLAKPELRPLVAAWLKDREEFVGTVKDKSHRAGHTVLWHFLHFPFHAGRIFRYAPRGLWRVVTAIWRWIFYAEAKSLRQEAVNSNQAPDFLKLEKERKERVALRWRGALVLLTLLVGFLFALWFLMPNWSVIFGFEMTRNWLFVIFGCSALLSLAHVGRDRDGKRPLFQQSITTNRAEVLTADIVLESLCSLGIQKMNDPATIEMLYGVKPGRVGYHLDFTLPRGVPATAVMAKRKELSAALRRPIGCVWPSVGPRHEGHLMLFISHEEMSIATQRPWPLLKSGAVDLFEPVPMFTDQRGDWVSLRIATKSGVVGAIPRMGKTFFLRELGLVGALDVRAELYIFELKCMGDMSSLKLVAHYYSDSDEEDDIAEHLGVMRKLKAERRRRTSVVKELPDERCPRSEVTTELASDKSLGLHPILVIIDECQTWTEYKIKAIREEFLDIIEELVRKGPAVAIQVHLATQKVDASSIPTVISTNAAVRLAFKVQDATSNNQILGPGSYANGIQATMFDFEKDKGVAYLKDGGPAQIVRTVFSLDKIESEKVALRARAMRQQAGRLTGYAAGADIEREAEQVILLDDVRQVFGTADAMHLVDIATGLAGLRPLLYGNLDAASLGSQLRAAGVLVDSVYVAGKPRDKASNKGLKREWLDVSSTLLVGDDEPSGEDPDDVRPLRRLTDDEVLTGKGRPS